MRILQLELVYRALRDRAEESRYGNRYAELLIQEILKLHDFCLIVRLMLAHIRGEERPARADKRRGAEYLAIVASVRGSAAPAAVMRTAAVAIVIATAAPSAAITSIVIVPIAVAASSPAAIIIAPAVVPAAVIIVITSRTVAMAIGITAAYGS